MNRRQSQLEVYSACAWLICMDSHGLNVGGPVAALICTNGLQDWPSELDIAQHK